MARTPFFYERQLVAAYAREDLLIRAAAQLERAAPWLDRRPSICA